MAVSLDAQPSGQGMGWSSPHPVEPAAGSWQPRPAPSPQIYHLPPPPANDSPETAAELAELERLTHSRTTADIEQILRWSVREPSLDSHWQAEADAMIRLYGLTPPAGARVHSLLGQAIYHVVIATWRIKYHYLRPRPSHLDPAVDTSIIPVPEHPAYPAGHSAVAGAAWTVLAHLFPREERRFAALAEDSGISRLKAGIHFRSDHTAGLELGRRVAADLLATAGQDGAPRVYTR